MRCYQRHGTHDVHAPAHNGTYRHTVGGNEIFRESYYMKPVKTVCIYNNQPEFEDACESLINNGYVLSSSSSGFHGDGNSSDVCFNATFVKPVSELAEEKISQSAPPTNSDYTKCSEEIMKELSGRRGIDLYQYDEDIIVDIRESITKIIAEHFA